MTKFATFDIEIMKELPEGTSDWQPFAPLGITCAAIATREHGVERFYAWPAMSKADVDAYVKRLQVLQQQGYLLVSVNGTAFDYRVLSQDSSLRELCATLALDSADLMLEVVFRKGYRLGLDAMLTGAGLTSKLHSVTLNDGSEMTNFSGAKAPAMWAAREFNAVLAYLDQDVMGLLNLCEWIDKNQCIQWTSKKGKPWRLPVARISPINKLHALPEPDTSWMDNAPHTRELYRMDHTSGLMRFIHASAHHTGLDDKSVQAIITSPPFYGQRVYEGNQDINWPAVEYMPMPGLPSVHIAGCDPSCHHEWQDGPVKTQDKRRDHNGRNFGNTRGQEPHRKGTEALSVTKGVYCAKCGGWRGGLGLEPDVFAYIGHLVLWLRECWRIMRDDALLVVELADSRSSTSTYNAPRKLHADGGWKEAGKRPNAGIPTGLKAKNLIQIAARFSMAAQADGWILRNKIVGLKTAPQPTSADDRFNDSYTEILMFSKQARYYSDMLAVRDYSKKQRDGKAATFARDGKDSQVGMPNQNFTAHRPDRTDGPGAEGHAHYDRIDWNPAPFGAAHFAVWPPSIPTFFIKMTTSAHGACPTCRAPWKRVVKKTFKPQTDVRDPAKLRKGSNKGMDESNGWGNAPRGTTESTTVGWKPTCKCVTDKPVVPCIVFDPFSGSGTTAIAAAQLGRIGIGGDLSELYLKEITNSRIGNGFQMEIAV